MDFFQTGKPDAWASDESAEPESSDDVPASYHSDKNLPLFKQDLDSSAEPGASGHLSLSDYISRHFSGSATSESAQPAPVPAPKLSFRQAVPTAKPRPEEGTPSGQILNSLDVELTSGLEQYMPTPAFRLRVMKKRLDNDIAELKMRLNKYERLPEQSSDMQARVRQVRQRLLVLEMHERRVSRELASILTFGSLFYEFSQRTQGPLQGISRAIYTLSSWLWHGLARLIYGRAYEEMETAGEDLRNLKDLFADRMQDRSASDSEISQLMTRYEKTLHDIEGAVLRLKKRS